MGRSEALRQPLPGLRAIASLLLVCCLAACGGGGGSSAPAPAPDTGNDGGNGDGGTGTPDTDPALTYTWSNAKWGGGGYVSGLLYHPSVQGLLYARTDVGGLYRRDPGSDEWLPLNDDIGRSDSQQTGVLSVAVDPRDSQKLYIATGQYLPSWAQDGSVYRSSDRGNTWTRAILAGVKLGGNSDGRGTGERLAVDPNKGSILFLGTNQDGLYTSTDSGASWSKVSGFTPTGVIFVLFDPAGGSAGNATQTLYAGVATTTGNSLYRSTDGGSQWSAVPGQPSGLMPLQGALASNGMLYLSYGNALGPNGITDGAVWKLSTSSGSWTNITPQAPTSSVAFGYGGLSVSAQDPNLVVVTTIDRWATGDEVYRSTSGGADWTGLTSTSARSAPGYPWLTAYYGGSLAGKLGHWMTDIEIDPFDSNHVVYNTGYGVWESLDADGSGTVNWSFAVDGMEETVSWRVVSPPAGAHLLTTQLDVGGARYGTDLDDVSGYFTDPHAHNYDIDVAELAPDIVVRTANTAFGAYRSTDNGVTWSHMAASPVTSGDEGAIALSAEGSSMVWVPGSQSAYYSTDGGNSWTPSSGYPTSGAMTSGSYYRPVGDRAVDATFYTYNTGTGTLLESTDGGKTFTTSLTGLDVLETWNALHTLLSIPGDKRRDLWLGNPSGLYHIDGPGAGATKIANVQSAFQVGYGAPAPGQPYPALFVVGTVNDTDGIHRSDDKGASWVRIDDDSHRFGFINAIAGDPRVHGRIYLATGGRGVIVGDR